MQVIRCRRKRYNFKVIIRLRIYNYKVTAYKYSNVSALESSSANIDRVMVYIPRRVIK